MGSKRRFVRGNHIHPQRRLSQRRACHCQPKPPQPGPGGRHVCRQVKAVDRPEVSRPVHRQLHLRVQLHPARLFCHSAEKVTLARRGRERLRHTAGSSLRHRQQL